MQKRYSFTSFFLVACVVIMIMSCKSRSYGSSPSLPQSESDSQLVIEDEDCFAWRFYLFTSMHSIVRQGAIEAVSYVRNKYLDRSKVYGPAHLDMNKILPPKTAQKIIDTIIEKEGGHCSREVLYETTPCAYEHVHKEGYQRIGGIVDADGAYTKINFSHFSESLGVPMNKYLLSEYKIFLGKHLSKSINTRYLTPRISCVDECHEDVFLLAWRRGYKRPTDVGVKTAHLLGMIFVPKFSIK